MERHLQFVRLEKLQKMSTEKKKIRLGQIGIGHNHGEAKMLNYRKFPELYDVVGFAEEDEEWFQKRGGLRGYSADAALFQHIEKNELSHRRAADIAMADEKYFVHWDYPF